MIVTSFSGSRPSERRPTRAARSPVAPKELTPTRLPSKCRGVGNVRARHERVQYPREIESQIAYRQAEDRTANDRAGAVAVIDVAGEQRLDAEIGAQRNVDQIDALVAVKAALDAVE